MYMYIREGGRPTRIIIRSDWEPGDMKRRK